MSTVREIRKQGRAVEVQFDDGTVLRCDRGFALVRSLAVGQTIDDAILTRVREQALRHDASESARRWLAARPRSRADIGKRLSQRGIPQPIVDETLQEMERLGRLNDRAYARSWADDRAHSRPRSARMVRAELVAQGIDGELAAEAVAGIDDDSVALTLARKRATRFRGDRETYQRRTAAALLRRGFSNGVVRAAVERAWVEREADGSQP
jgi:regulatory protein